MKNIINTEVVKNELFEIEYVSKETAIASRLRKGEKKYYRYMSEEEFIDFMSGELMHSDNKHVGKATDSKGFCWLSEEVLCHSDIEGDYNTSPLDAHEFLQGIVCDEILLEVKTSDKNLRNSRGVYADYASDHWGDCMSVEEYCCFYYSRDAFIPLRYAIYTYDIEYVTTDTKWNNEIKEFVEIPLSELGRKPYYIDVWDWHWFDIPQ